MKNLYLKLGWYLILVLGSNTIMGQSVITVSFENANVGNSLDGAIKQQLLSRVTKLMEEYDDVARFDETSDYVNFENVFSDEPQLYNDLEVNPTRTNLDFVDYLSKVESALVTQGGFPFELNSTKIIELGVSANQLYLAKVRTIKNIPFKINKNGLIKKGDYKEEITLFIEVNPYDMDDAYIYQIQGSKKAELDAGVQYVIPKDNRISFSLRAGYGSITNGKGTASLVLNEAKSVFTSYGAEIEFRRNINKTESLYLVAGLIGEFGKVTSDISSFDLSRGTESEGFRFRDDALNDITIPYYKAGVFDGLEGKKPSPSNLLPIDFINGEETLNLTLIQGKVGIGYVLYEGFGNDKLFIDLCVHVNSLTSRADGDVRGELFGLVLPSKGEDLPFPSIDQLYDFGIITGDRDNLKFEDIQVDSYKGSKSFPSNSNDDLDIAPETNLSFGISISPVYHNQITRRLGIVLGLDYYYSITSLFNNKERVNGLFSGENYTDRKSSVLEDYFETNRLGKLGAKFGVIFRF